jgi:hypothetical protein
MFQGEPLSSTYVGGWSARGYGTRAYIRRHLSDKPLNAGHGIRDPDNRVHRPSQIYPQETFCPLSVTWIITAA